MPATAHPFTNDDAEYGLIKALLLERGVEAGIEHRLEILADRLPAGDPWHERLEPLLYYSAYATAFRYPTPAGRIVSKPPAGDVLRDVEAVRRFVVQARGTSEG